MKLLLTTLLSLSISFSALAVNDTVENVVTNSTGTNGLLFAVALDTTNILHSLKVSTQNYKNLGLSLITKLGAAGTAAVNYKFLGSCDGTNFSTAVKRTLIVTPAGTLSVNTVTNFDVTGFRYLLLYSIENGSGAILTNQQFDLSYKAADN